MKPDIQIALEHTPTPIKQIVQEKLGLTEDDLIPYGNYIAKVTLPTLNNLVAGKYRTNEQDGKLIVVTAITPTRAGEGKTVTTIGLTQSLDYLGKRAQATIRQPSMGPVFGVKGGATGGGMSQVYPMWKIDLEFTGDIHAVTSAHNLLSALIDNHLAKDNRLNIDPTKVTWLRALDMNDRALRKILIGLGGRTKGGLPREDGFLITAASEIMSVLALSRNISELKERLANITIGYTYDDKPVYARDLKAVGAMALILRDALKPNLVQTLSGAPASIHCGPFGNVAHGTASITSILMALRTNDYVVNETGFASDLGLEKFVNITCRRYNLVPSAVVVVASCRALRLHGGVAFEQSKVPNIDALQAGVVNLDAHLDIVKNFGLKPVVAINQFATDSEEEMLWLQTHCEELGVPSAVSEVYEKGAPGGIALAQKVIEVAESEPTPELQFTYDLADPIKEKIAKIANQVYGATNVAYSTDALRALQQIEAHDGTAKRYPICMAKTQSSISDDPLKLGAPRGFTVTVDDMRLYTGAEFIVPICGGILLMPGLPDVPASEGMDIDDEENIIGLF
ncbi:MAG TPA: formate--tetrahydrofolate ligase [Candidatus Lokiarchaeia archaeon]|nr:formate--tetrahydrofolate ligase [Candidatus Lokiarchaeia archaeon]